MGESVRRVSCGGGPKVNWIGPSGVERREHAASNWRGPWPEWAVRRAAQAKVAVGIDVGSGGGD